MTSAFQRRLACALLLMPLGFTAYAQSTPPPTSAPSYEQRFQAARELAFGGKREQAIAAYSQLLAESPDNSDVLLGRGRVYAWEGRWAEAVADLTAATTRAPTYADAWSALGDMYVWSDQPAQALTAYSRWVDVDAASAPAYIARGRAQRALGNIDAARADFEQAARHGAPSDEVQTLLASLVKPRVQNPEAVVPEGYKWSASLSASMTDFTPHRGHWSDNGLSVRRYFDKGSLALETLAAKRFGNNDRAWALDAYVDLWPRAYANLRYQHAPSADLYPIRSMRAEVFQGVGQGWELSASYDRLDFSRRTELYGVAVGRYVGEFYLRVRSLYIPGQNSSSVSHRGLVRWYYAGNGDDYFEINAGSGRSSESLIDADTVRRSGSQSAGVAWSKYLTAHWGLKLGASYSQDSGNGYTERGVSASLYHRW